MTRLTVGFDGPRRPARRPAGGDAGRWRSRAPGARPRRPAAFGIVQVMVGAALVAGMSLAGPAASAASAKAPALTDEILPSDEPSPGAETEAEGESAPDADAPGSGGSEADNEPEKQDDPEGSESSGDENATEEPADEPTSGAGSDVDASDKAASSDEPSQDADGGAETEATPDAEATEPADEPTKQEQPENTKGSGDETAKEEPADKPKKQEGPDTQESPAGPGDEPAKEEPPFEGGESPPQAVQPLAHLQTFDCGPGAPGILTQATNWPTLGGPTNGEFVDIVTGQSQTDFVVAGYTINAAGYNVLDDYVYGWDLDSPQQLVRVGADGNVHDLGTPGGLTSGNLVVGDIDDNGQYWAANPGTGDWYKIDLQPGSATYNQVVAFGTISPWPTSADWTFVPGTNSLYSVGQDQNGNDVLFGFDRTTQTFTSKGLLGTDSIASGAMYAGPDGFMYTSNNGDGVIHRIDVGNVTAVEFADGPSSGSNDGARCHSSPIPIDFGDAPASYGTTLVDDGPRHVIGNYDADTNTAPLMLGAGIDSETDGVPSGDASSDADDGVGAPIVMSGTTDTTVSVSATNNTGEDAILAGWIDLDGNGTFDPGEMVTTTVPANSGLGSYDLTFPGGTVDADTFARFRLFPGDTPAADILPTGSAAGGEVEDYPVAYRELEIDKTSDATADTIIGDTVTYQVEITNPGTADYTAADPASFEDDLSDVLDDATFVSGSLSAGAGTTSFTDPMVSWEGPLAAGDTVTVTYQVELTGDGDGVVRNKACVPADEVGPDDDPCDHVEILLPRLAIDKSADTTEVSAVGDTVTFTVEATNVGPGDYTSASPAPVTDDLTEVVDDATFNTGSLTADKPGTLDFTDPMVSWEGPLASGETVTLEYTVTYTGEGDQLLENKVCVPEEQVAPGEVPCEEVEVPGPRIEDYKDVDPNTGTPVVAGQELTYTVTFTNVGQVAGDVDKVDDLSHILDDADLVDGPAVSDSALSASGPDGNDQISITGMLEPGQTETVTYTVRVREADQRGDDALANFLLDPGEEPPAEPVCEPAEGEMPDCTFNPISAIEVVKSADPESGTAVSAGQELTYQITFTNTGEGAGKVDFIDHAGEVFDDAELVNGPAVSDEALTVSGPDSVDQIHVTGTLEPGQSVTVAYAVEVKDYDQQGDHNLGNFMTTPGEAPPEECPEGSPLCTEHPVEEEPLPITGISMGTTSVAGLGVTMLLAGLVLVAAARRNRDPAGKRQDRFTNLL